MTAKEVENLKLRIAALLNCSELNDSQVFVEGRLQDLNLYGVDTYISEKQMDWLIRLFVKHQIKHPDDPSR
jgi:hypothetical protein